LERVSRAISTQAESLLARADRSLDKLVARYAATFFKDAPAKAADRQLNHSWQLLGQGLLAALFNIILFLPIFYLLLPIRLITLLMATPFRMLSERSRSQRAIPAESEETKKKELQSPPAQLWLAEPAFGVAEHTTEHLAESGAEPRRVPAERKG
jgi:hypothetical protein